MNDRKFDIGDKVSADIPIRVIIGEIVGFSDITEDQNWYRVKPEDSKHVCIVPEKGLRRLKNV